MKKVIIAIPYLSGKGGTETVIQNFADALNVKKNVNNIYWKLISFGGTSYPYWLNNWNKVVYNFSKYRFIQNIAYVVFLPVLIAYTLIKEKPDYFIATHPVIWSIAYVESFILSKKTKVGSWYHYSFKMKHVKRIFLKMVDFFWVISSGIKSELVSMGISSKSIYVLYNPINIDVPVKMVKRTGYQNKYIYIGRIDYDETKNVSELIKALSIVKGIWQCDLYGYISKSTLNRFRQLINELNIKNEIKFHGFSEDVWSKIKTADVLVLTSKHEGFGMVLCEAAMRGIPIISSNCPVGPKDIVNKNNGFLYETGNYKQLATILNSIIDNKLKLPCPKKVNQTMEKFSFDKYSKRVYNFFVSNK